ncbi:FHA domain-containing protein [Maridesulfovibrio sp.]|uniref:FHA domain-containing protein n=1 Tax=Maridesulfovibrio sp. TaxID=2795000 RepID=UPI002A1892BE|nr:FHA domain-containing protein [Maridesulfovibrio sp.]
MTARLTCLDDSRLPEAQKNLVINLDKTETSIGRGPQNTSVISHSSISRNHALITSTDEGLIIKDTGSTNGVWINGERTTEARLGNGDTVAFGSLMFRFEVTDEPEPADQISAASSQTDPRTSPSKDTRKSAETKPKPKVIKSSATEAIPHNEQADGEESIADKTMLYGDSRASEAMLDAINPDHEKPDEPAPLPPRHRQIKAETVEQADPPERKRSRMPFAVIAAIIVAGLLAWWGIEAHKAAEDNNFIQTHEQEIDDFVEQYEFWTRRFNLAQNSEQLTELKRISENLSNDIKLRPDLARLKPLLVEVHFLKLERETRRLINENNPEAALRLIDIVHESAQNFAAKELSPETKRALQRFMSLADLLETIARYKIFQKKFPDPSAYANTPLPDSLRGKIASAKKLKIRFAKLLKENNMQLKVRFRLTRGMANDTDENCVLLVNRWYHMAFSKKPENG